MTWRKWNGACSKEILQKRQSHHPEVGESSWKGTNTAEEAHACNDALIWHRLYMNSFTDRFMTSFGAEKHFRMDAIRTVLHINEMYAVSNWRRPASVSLWMCQRDLLSIIRRVCVHLNVSMRLRVYVGVNLSVAVCVSGSSWMKQVGMNERPFTCSPLSLLAA